MQTAIEHALISCDRTCLHAYLYNLYNVHMLSNLHIKTINKKFHGTKRL